MTPLCDYIISDMVPENNRQSFTFMTTKGIVHFKVVFLDLMLILSPLDVFNDDSRKRELIQIED